MFARIWYYLCKAVGDKAGKNNSEADTIAFIRLLIVLQAVITNFYIIAGIIRHW